MIKHVRLYAFASVLLMMGVFACIPQKLDQTSSDRLYKKDNNELNAKYVVYHINDTVSQLFYDISNETVVYKKTDTSSYFYSDLKIVLQISLEDNIAVANDTASVVIKDRQSNVDVKQLRGSLFFRLKSGLNYYIDVTTYDANKKTKYTSSVFADKTSKSVRQIFLATSVSNAICFSPYFKPQETVYISSKRVTENTFTVDYFKSKFKLAIPPFSTDPRERFSYKPDSTFTVTLNENKIELMMPSNGFYHLKTNDVTKEGVTFFVYEPSYPKIKNAEQMILATRYIMAKKEFDNCMNAVDKKTAIDNFWLELGGSGERAKELLKKYYGRVQESNKLFTSYQEGWKTDRGMIYIVFGAPNKVSKRKNGEMWTYGDVGNPNSTFFQFIKVINPFTDNDYVLDRNETFKMPWYQAVDMWRQGRVYLDN